MHFFKGNSLLQNVNDPLLSEGLHRGYGIFETICISEQTPLFLEKHICRLIRSATIAQLELQIDKIDLQNKIKLLLEKNNLKSAALKILAFKNNNTTEILLTTRVIPYNKEEYTNGHSLYLSKIYQATPFPLCQIKSTNYLSNVLAKQEALDAGYTDSLLINTNSEICETTRANIFFLRDDCLYTPSLKCGLLPGIMREHVLRIAKDLGLPLKIGSFNVAEIQQADEIFLTNSLMGIMPVAKISNTPLDIKKYIHTTHLTKKLSELTSAYKNKLCNLPTDCRA